MDHNYILEVKGIKYEVDSLNIDYGMRDATKPNDAYVNYSPNGRMGVEGLRGDEVVAKCLVSSCEWAGNLTDPVLLKVKSIQESFDCGECGMVHESLDCPVGRPIHR